MKERARLSLQIAVRMALADLPWRLLTGAEKGARPRDETMRRLDEATARIIARIEFSNLEVEHRPSKAGFTFDHGEG